MRLPALAFALLLPALAQAQTDPWVGRFGLRELPLMQRVLLEVKPDRRGGYLVKRTSDGRTLEGTATLSGGRLEVRYPTSRGLTLSLSGIHTEPLRGSYYRMRGNLFGWSAFPLGRRYEVGDALVPPDQLRDADLHGRLRVVGTALRDPMGRDVLLRGVNVGKKSDPFLPPHDDEAISKLVRATGVNFVRFSITWRAIEPQPSTYDTDYLDRMTEQIRAWSDAGVYVLVDMHQDVWGGPLARHGAPDWATLALTAKPLELPEGAPWQARYLDPRCSGSFEALWANATVPASGRGLQEHYAQAWAQVASRLRGIERVAGYDLINEPFYGREIRGALARLSFTTLTRLGDLRLVGGALGGAARAMLRGEPVRDALLAQLLVHARRPDVFDALARSLAGATRRFERRLSTFYERVGRDVRGADPGRPLFLEPLSLAGVGVPSRLTVRGLDQLVYAPHLYDPFLDSGLGNDGELRRVRRSLQRSQATARRLGWPLVFGEWGNVHHAGKSGARFAVDNGRMIDHALAGAAYWDHVPGREAETSFMAAMSPYPRRVAGTLREIRWDPAAKKLVVRLRARGLAHPTVIQLHPKAFPSGVTVSLSDPWSTSRVDGQQVLVWSPRAGNVTITIRGR